MERPAVHDAEAEVARLAESLRLLHAVNEALPAESEASTFLSLLGKTYDENFISDYLAFLLDPRRNGIGSEPLEALLAAVGEEDTEFAQDEVTVRREHTFPDGGRIDLLVEIDERIVIGIENKVLSAEAVGQTAGYEQAIKGEFPDRAPIFVLLAPGARRPSSREFRVLSYAQLHDALKEIEYPWIRDVRRGFLWQEFLAHIQEYITVSKTGVPSISRRTQLYLEHKQDIQAVLAACKDDGRRMCDFISAKLRSYADASAMEPRDFRGCQTLSFTGWEKRPEYWIFLGFWFDARILEQPSVRCAIEVQGSGTLWNKSEHIEGFLGFVRETYPELRDLVEAQDLQYEPRDPRKTALAQRFIALEPDPEAISSAFDKALDDFGVLFPAVTEAVAAYERSRGVEA